METKKVKKWCVYIHSCKISNKAYIGVTNDIKERWRNKGSRYLVKRKDGRYAHPVFAQALIKYPDWDNDWEHIIFMDGLTESEAHHIECLLIALFQTNVCRYGPDAGYNCTDGGEGSSGRIITDETRRKISEALMGMFAGEKNPNYGKPLSEERRKQISETNRNRICTDETKEKLRIAFSGENNPMYGQTHTEEARKQISI